MEDPVQLALVEIPAAPKVTERQQRAVDLLQAAGVDGLTSDELGANFHRHNPDDRCLYCGSTGKELGRALRRKGIAKQRKRKAPGGDHYLVWISVDAKPGDQAAGDVVLFTRPDGTTGDIPF